ncbi:MAG: hypothetical protein SGJ20_22710 [Planctomycetota bacterium]|nr:hypothetical protein [Planctomycetota bacterium]
MIRHEIENGPPLRQPHRRTRRCWGYGRIHLRADGGLETYVGPAQQARERDLVAALIVAMRLVVAAPKAVVWDGPAWLHRAKGIANKESSMCVIAESAIDGVLLTALHSFKSPLSTGADYLPHDPSLAAVNHPDVAKTNL